MNRETWLDMAVEELRTLFKVTVDIDIPTVRLSAGFPSRGGLSLKKKVLGECWKPEVAADGVSQIFLNPMMTDSVQVIGTLAHELIHAWDKGVNKHRGPFVAAAKEFGLVGPWTATSVGEELRPVLEEIVSRIGEYPHSKLTPSVQQKVQTTRMLKLTAPDCGCTVRTTRKYLDLDGAFTCPHGEEMVEQS